MTKSKQTITAIGAAILIVVTALAVGPLLNNYFQKNNDGAMSSMPMASSSSSSLIQKDSNDYKAYAELTGDTYDKAFIKNMISHHEGAVSMAQAALTSAKRQEIKNMANNIISTQSEEISKMKRWQQQWGYGDENPTTNSGSMDHDSMGMNMTNMEDALKGKTGDDFDEAFLTQMIMHHQSAINMAAPGEKNAKHQEVKDLTKAVVEAQSKEVNQMRMWQKDWGY